MNSAIKSFKSLQISFWTAIIFLVLFLLVHLLKPEIDPSWRFVSELAIGRFGWIMSAAFLALALSYAALSAGLWQDMRLGGKVGLVFLSIGSLGLILAALFTTQPIHTNPDEYTLSSTLHALGAVLGSNGAAAGSLIITLTFIFGRQKSSFKWLIFAVMLFVIIGYVWFISSIPQDGKFGPEITIGLPNRFLMFSYFLWPFVTSVYVRRIMKSKIQQNSVV